MKKASNIIYWIATCWLALGMLSTAIVQLMQTEKEVALMSHLGYPLYFLTLIGVWKILGVIVLFIPKFPLIREWAYAGFFFAMSGAVVSHIAAGSAAADLFGPGLLLALTVVSWYFRPAAKRMVVTVN